MDSAANPAERADMVQRLSSRSHRYTVRGERRVFRMEEWADIDGVIHLFAWTITEGGETSPQKNESFSRALAFLENIVRGASKKEI